MDSDTQSFWNSRFRQEEFVYGLEANAFLQQAAQHLPPAAEILSLGDGEGRNSVHLARQGHRVTAVDIAEAGLDKARRLAAQHGVQIDTVHADLAELEIEAGRWHAVVSIFCHLPNPLRQQVLTRVMQGLRPGGWLILVGYTPRQLQYGTGGPKEPALLYEPDALRAELAGLELRHCEEVVREVREGRLHTGQAAVLQLLAQKPLR